MVRGGKGDKDRVTMLPASVKADLARNLQTVRAQHERDLQHGAGWVELPTALARKYPNAGREWVWQWVFPATRPYRHPDTGLWRRHHLHESVLQRVVKDAARRAGIPKRATPHSARGMCIVHHLSMCLIREGARGGRTQFAGVCGRLARPARRFERRRGRGLPVGLPMERRTRVGERAVLDP